MPIKPFESYEIDKSGDCWLWLGPKQGDGYGAFGTHGLAHRESYKRHIGKLGSRDRVGRSCGVPNCVKPEHLVLNPPHKGAPSKAFEDYPIEKTDSCWIWRGPVKGNGYGGLKGAKDYAHRYVWERENGPIPKGMYICHACDQPLCCRPSHLFLGTATDNMQDAKAKGRVTYIRKLTAEHVLDIRRKYYLRNLFPTNKAKLAKEYGVSFMTITHIVRMEQWQHLYEIQGLS